jgi:hypothetical protein
MSSPLWLIDRSRVADGRGFCARSRYLNNHTGPHGYGIQLKGTRIPLSTGTAYHAGLAKVLEYCQDFLTSEQAVKDVHATYGQAVPNTVVRAAVQDAQLQYGLTVAARGFAYMADQPAVAETLREQNYLIEGLIWAWVLEVLPEVLSRGRVVEVEHDETFVFGCTCGLSDGVGSQADHEARECQGIGLMCKPDFLLETWATQELEYHEFKGTGSDGPAFRDKWEVMIQMFAATLDAERRRGKSVGAIYVHGLLKGRRGQEYNPESGKYDVGPDRQSSVLVYGYRKPAVPPMEAEEWAAQYSWQELDEKSGQVVNRRLGKVWKKAGVWDLPEQLLTPELQSRAEWWAKWIPAEVRRKQLVVLGPFSRQAIMVPHFLEECVGEEGRWRQGLWDLYERGQQIIHEAYANGSGVLPEDLDQMNAWWEVVWPDPRFQSLLDRLFPRSYECRRYGEKSSCQFENICFGREGWAAPLGSGKYILRRPHHQPELDQAIARGCLLPDEGTAASGEEIE